MRTVETIRETVSRLMVRAWEKTNQNPERDKKIETLLTFWLKRIGQIDEEGRDLWTLLGVDAQEKEIIEFFMVSILYGQQEDYCPNPLEGQFSFYPHPRPSNPDFKDYLRLKEYQVKRILKEMFENQYEPPKNIDHKDPLLRAYGAVGWTILPFLRNCYSSFLESPLDQNTHFYQAQLQKSQETLSYYVDQLKEQIANARQKTWEKLENGESRK